MQPTESLRCRSADDSTIMNITAIKTELVTPGAGDLLVLLDRSLPPLEENSVVAITSKVVSLCEGRVVPRDQADKEQLVIDESDLYMPSNLSRYGHHFTVAQHTLIAMAGIDESNSQDTYVLWPVDPQATANTVRKHLQTKHGLENIGVVITDSTCQPLRRGTTGISLAHSGFLALHDYIGQPDLFGRPFAVSQASISGGLAAAAVLAMGEGREQTPLAIVTDVPFVQFVDHDPQPDELDVLRISLEEDLFAPFLESVEWLPGQRGQTSHD